MQDGCLNTSINCVFGFLDKETWWNTTHDYKRKFRRLKRMQNGHKGKEMWFHNCLEGKGLDIFLCKSVNKCYHQHAGKYYDKLTKLYRMYAILEIQNEESIFKVQLQQKMAYIRNTI
jgi:hypothetical protein